MAKTDYTDLLSDLGTDANEEIKFESAIEEAIILFVNKMTDDLRNNLSSKDAYYQKSELMQSIATLPLNIQGTKFIMSIEMNGYADYLNKGVSGIKNKFDSPYAFKFQSVSDGFRDNLKRWITKRGFPLESRYSKTKDLTKSKRAEKQIDEKTQMAYAYGMVIKRDGIEANHFIDEVYNTKSIEQFGKSLAKMMGRRIKVSITNKLIDNLEENKK
jgi:hypothetical protein